MKKMLLIISIVFCLGLSSVAQERNTNSASELSELWESEKEMVILLKKESSLFVNIREAMMEDYKGKVHLSWFVEWLINYYDREVKKAKDLIVLNEKILGQPPDLKKLVELQKNNLQIRKFHLNLATKFSGYFT